jgi:acyl-CoA dehydrogenase
MTGDSQLIEDAARRVFRELGQPQSLKSRADRDLLWNALDAAGLTRAWVCEALGGSGASLSDGFTVLRIAGEHAANIPLAETLIAGWLLEQAQIAVPATRLSLAPVDVRDSIELSPDNTLTGSARAVPYARECEQFAMLVTRDRRSYVALLDASQIRISERTNVAGEARDTLVIEDARPVSLAPISNGLDELMLLGAVVRAAQMAGALQALLELSVAYANERVAFEKPIGKFQAIQHSLARLAGEAAAAIAAAGSAADAMSCANCFDTAILLEGASAKVRTGEAATAGTAIAHQVHGAIGLSREYALHHFTQRLWAWRDDFGHESYWAARLGQLVAQRGADELWPLLAAQ